MPPISIGEIHIPGGSGLVSARTLTLTSPPSDEGGLELFFGLFAADAPKKVVEKLCDRLTEEFRPIYFRSGNPEARFEAALKQANKSILAFLYEHGLSLPGVKLRGAVAALAGGKLYAASRGAIRGTLYVPGGSILAPHALFDETSEKAGEPKFFTSLQTGPFQDGARLVISTSELFQALDDGYVSDTLGQADFAKASRDIKHALRAGKFPVSILALSSPNLETADVPQPTAKVQRTTARASSGTGNRPTPPPIVGPDIGELIARWIRSGLMAVAAISKAGTLLIWKFLRRLALLPLYIPRLVKTLVNKDERSRILNTIITTPNRFFESAVGRMNALPSRNRNHFLVLLLFGAVFIHGMIFSVLRGVSIREAKAYDAALSELQSLEGDFEAGIIYENEGRGRELLARMESIAQALPEETETQRTSKSEARDSIERAKDKLRRIVEVKNPEVFSKIEGVAAFEPSSMAWFDGKLYVFSSTSGRVRVISSEGAASSDPEISVMASGVTQAAVARTGFILKDAAGKTVYWNPDNGETVEYPDAGLGATPMLFYQSRLYTAAPDGTVSRRSVATKNLGAASDVLRGAPRDPTGIATDGAIYILYADGSTRKYMKGATVTEYSPTKIEPPASNASQPWASIDSNKLMFIDKGGDRAYALEKSSGRLLAQITSPLFKGLSAVSANEKGSTLYLLAGDGTIYEVPVK